MANVIEVTELWSCLALLHPPNAPAEGFQYLMLPARQPKVGSCAVKPWVFSSQAGDAGADPRGFGAGVVLLGVTGGVGGPWMCLAPHRCAGVVLKLPPCPFR